MLAISPGGVYEAQFGDSTYQLMWKNRMGFAKAAIDAKKVGKLLRELIYREQHYFKLTILF